MAPRDFCAHMRCCLQAERASFLEFAPSYFEHMAKGMLSGQGTTLAKILGAFSVNLKTAAG